MLINNTPSLTVNGGEVNAYGFGENGVGISAHAVTIDGGEVYAYGGEGNKSIGIYAEKNFTVTDGTVSTGVQ